MTKNIIELNGKRYDAVTGKLLTSEAPHAPTASHKTGKVIDSVVRSSGTHIKPRVHHATAPAQSRPTPKASAHHTVAPHSPAHQPERAQTLMRQAVKAPAHSLKRHVKVAVHTDTVAKRPTIAVAPKLSWQTVDEARLKHAKHIAKSSLVSHFGAMPIAATKSAATHPAHMVAAAHGHVTVKHVQPAMAIARAVQPIDRQPSTDIFERALAHANSHLQPAPVVKLRSKKSRRARQFLGFSASTLVALFAMGFVVYQNVAAIQVHIASSRAGINATMPSWQPGGFTAEQFASSPGKVMIGFTSENDRHFSLTQTASKWDSSALLNEYVSPHNNTYDTIQADGRLIYTYGNNNASWVSGGIWYQLTSDGALSTSQLVRLATST